MGVTLARNYPLKIHIIEIIPWILTPTECLTACVVASRVSLELIRRAVWRDKKTTLKLQKKKKKTISGVHGVSYFGLTWVGVKVTERANSWEWRKSLIGRFLFSFSVKNKWKTKRMFLGDIQKGRRGFRRIYI
jgi:hypothetical protein